MSALFTEPVLTAFVLAVAAAAIPLMLAAAGEAVGEQAGMLNIGIDGLMLVGGYSGFVATLSTGSFWLGFLCGMLAGAALSCVSAVLCVRLGLNQIVVGIGIGLAGAGLSSLLYDANFADSKPRLGVPAPWVIPILSDIPVVGPGLFAQSGLFAASLAVVALTALWLRRTLPGLRLRAAGQSPASLDASGGNVTGVRAGAVLFGGAMAGLGGAYMTLVAAGTFTPGMTHGVGFLAIVVAMLARGSLLRVAFIAVAYGLCIAAGTALQLASVNIPTDAIHMVPFVVVIAALACFPRRSALPPALATPYVRGAR